MKEFELEPGEHIVLQVRKHWLLFVGELLPYAILAVIPFALPKILAILPVLSKYVVYFDYQNPLGRAGLAVYLLVTWTSAWGALTRYFLNAWVLTNQRICTIKQRNFFHREVSSLLLPRIQDVTTNVDGFVESLLNIGDIKVESAGAEIEFRMRGIPEPERMRDIILKYASAEPSKTGL
jgi:uncharacterized membrane protein YdbT with pleckstrin-like domain